MALLRCPECGHAVSDQAGKCPNCGCPVGTAASTHNRPLNENDQYYHQQEYKQPVYDQRQSGSDNKSGGKIAILILVLVIIIGGVVFGFWYINHDSDKTDTQDQNTEQQKEDQQPQQDTDESQYQDQQQNTNDQTQQNSNNADDQEYEDPGEDGGTEDNGASGGQDVTDDNP